MKITHFITSIDLSTGGPARSVTQLISGVLDLKKYVIELITSKSDAPILQHFKQTNGKISLLKSLRLSKLDLPIKALKETDLFHGHGLWQMPVHQMASYARKHNKPYIITPRGMLEPWSLAQGKLKKQVAMLLFQHKDLRKATCLHATAIMEAESIRALGYKNPIAVIPNGIDISQFSDSFPKKTTNKKHILFLSRIHKKKGIEHLIEAWGMLEESIKQQWEVTVVGNGEDEYIQQLKQLIKTHQLEGQIHIKPPVFGEAKIALFRSASLFVLPTYSENFGIVIAEALAAYTPVITTKGTPWEELNTKNCGWHIDIGVAPLKVALEEALLCSQDQLEIMGKNGRALIENSYSLESVALQMQELYDWILKGTDKPEFVN